MKSFLAYIILFISVACHAQAIEMRIWVKDLQDRQPVRLAKASYTLNGNTLTFTSDNMGKIDFHAVNLPLNLEWTAPLYDAYKITLDEKDLEKNGDHYTYTVYLERSSNHLQEIVITGQNTPVLATRSIYKVQTIGETQIHQRAAVSLNDVLNYEMNNFVSNDNLLGSSTSIGGIGGQNVKILLNGIPVMGRENGNIDLGQMNMANIKRIEMIQGPMSVMYGSNALGGVINLITQQSPDKFHWGIRSFLESTGRYNFSSNLAFNRRRHSLQASAARNFFQGWTPKDSVDRYQLWKPKTQYLADLQYTYSWKQHKFRYFTSYLNEKITNKGVPIVNPYEGYAFDEYYRTHRYIHSLSADFQLNEKEKVSLINSYSAYSRTKNRFKKNLVSLEQAETQSIGDQDTTRFNNINLRGTLSSSRVKNTDLTAGYEYTYELGRSFKLANEKQQIAEIGLFASALYSYRSIQVQPSFRMTYNSRFQTAFTPAFHARADLGGNTQFRASYARGFRTPTLKEMYLQFIDQNHTIIGNPELKPEIGDHYEAGIEKQVKSGTSLLTFNITGYHNEIKNLISLAVYNQHGVLRKYSNIEQYNNWMLNSQAKMKHKNFSGSLGAGLIWVEGSKVIPGHQILEWNSLLSYTWLKYATSFNFNYKYNSRQPVITVDNQFLYTDPVHIGNASVQKSFLKNKIQWQLGVRNLFNIQTTALNGAAAGGSGGHSSSNGMQMFPARSIFTDLNISL